MKIIFWLIIVGVVGFSILAFYAGGRMNEGCDERHYLHCS